MTRKKNASTLNIDLHLWYRSTPNQSFMTSTSIQIKGTHCHSCKALIEDVSMEIDGIKSCNVDFETGKTTIEYDGEVDWGKFKKEVEALGDYKVIL